MLLRPTSIDISVHRGCKSGRTAARVLFENTAEIQGIVISHGKGNLRDGHIGGKQQIFGTFHPNLNQIGVRGEAGIFFEFVNEIISAHITHSGIFLHASAMLVVIVHLLDNGDKGLILLQKRTTLLQQIAGDDAEELLKVSHGHQQIIVGTKLQFFGQLHDDGAEGGFLPQLADMSLPQVVLFQQCLNRYAGKMNPVGLRRTGGIVGIVLLLPRLVENQAACFQKRGRIVEEKVGLSRFDINELIIQSAERPQDRHSFFMAVKIVTAAAVDTDWLCGATVGIGGISAADDTEAAVLCIFGVCHRFSSC